METQKTDYWNGCAVTKIYRNYGIITCIPLVPQMQNISVICRVVEHLRI